MQEHVIAREKYRPQSIKLMFIAEAPPCTEGQFFYFENVLKGDSLFLHVIRAVFPDLEGMETKELRARKEEMLYRFRDEGYFLEDSVFDVIPKGTSAKDKEKAVVGGQQNLVERITPYKTSTKFILLSALVFRTNYELLKKEGFDILNEQIIPFPGSGQQGKFKQGMASIEIP